MGKLVEWEGWIGKLERVDDIFQWDKYNHLVTTNCFVTYLSEAARSKIHWHDYLDQWPPRKVRVTVEEVG